MILWKIKMNLSFFISSASKFQWTKIYSSSGKIILVNDHIFAKISSPMNIFLSFCIEWILYSLSYRNFIHISDEINLSNSNFNILGKIEKLNIQFIAKILLTVWLVVFLYCVSTLFWSFNTELSHFVSNNSVKVEVFFCLDTVKCQKQLNFKHLSSAYVYNLNVKNSSISSN